MFDMIADSKSPYYLKNRERFLARTRASNAKRGGFKPPPLEKDCPPRPADGCCQYCRRPAARLVMDHNHKTGAFLAWCCYSCNTKITDAMDDFGVTPPRNHKRRAQPCNTAKSRTYSTTS